MSLSTPVNMTPMDSPLPLWATIIFDSNFEDAATVILWPYMSSYSLAFMPTYAYQYWQSAAPPARVESRNSFSSITFLQVSEELKSPIDARESTAKQTPAAMRKARHVVPFL